MESIKFVKDIWYDVPDGTLNTWGKHFLKASNFFIRQGNLDASCAVYSLMMMLMIHKKVTYSELTSREIAQNKSDGGYNSLMRLQDMFLHDLEGLYLKDAGYDFKTLSEDLQSCYNKHAKSDFLMLNKPRSNSKKKQELKGRIIKRIDQGYPVEIGFTYDGGKEGHAVVAIGYSFHKSYLRLYCLDPANDLRKVAFWNAIIDIYNKDDRSLVYEDYYGTEEGYEPISVDEILTIE